VNTILTYFTYTKALLLNGNNHVLISV